MANQNPSSIESSDPSEGTPIVLDRSELLGFDQADETFEPGQLGAHLSAKIGGKPGDKPRSQLR